ncbi:hypothetical protein BGX34_004182, partial [Mortierella sp. NVP85]
DFAVRSKKSNEVLVLEVKGGIAEVDFVNVQPRRCRNYRPDRNVFHHDWIVWCGNLYLMARARDVTIPDSLRELVSIRSQIKIWNDLKATVEQGLDPLLAAMESDGKLVGTIDPHSLAHTRIPTTRTPEFKTFLGRA